MKMIILFIFSEFTVGGSIDSELEGKTPKQITGCAQSYYLSIDQKLELAIDNMSDPTEKGIVKDILERHRTFQIETYMGDSNSEIFVDDFYRHLSDSVIELDKVRKKINKENINNANNPNLILAEVLSDIGNLIDCLTYYKQCI